MSDQPPSLSAAERSLAVDEQLWAELASKHQPDGITTRCLCGVWWPCETSQALQLLCAMEDRAEAAEQRAAAAEQALDRLTKQNPLRAEAAEARARDAEARARALADILEDHATVCLGMRALLAARQQADAVLEAGDG